MEGALRLLQYVEARRPTGRRFGADADARWSSFRGDLETVDRIELMIRDADAEWPGGFGARGVFAMHGVAEDEPFGSPWQGLDPVAAEELWRRVKADPAPATPAAALAAIASAWGVTLTRQPSEPVAPTDHLVVVGPSAIAPRSKRSRPAPRWTGPSRWSWSRAPRQRGSWRRQALRS